MRLSDGIPIGLKRTCVREALLFYAKRENLDNKSAIITTAMNPYLATKNTVPPGYGHSLFSPVHILTLVCIALFIFFISRVYKKSDEEKRRRILWIIAVLLILDEALKDSNALLTGQWTWDLLPLHLCSVNIFVILYDAFHPSVYVKNYLYAVCIPASLAALIFPSWMTSLPYFSLMSIHSWSVHIMLLIYPVLLLSGGFRPSYRFFLSCRVILPFAFLLVFDYFFNLAFDTDFFFLSRGGGEGNPLSFFASVLPYPLYLLFVALLLSLMVTLMYALSYKVKKLRKN